MAFRRRARHRRHWSATSSTSSGAEPTARTTTASSTISWAKIGAWFRDERPVVFLCRSGNRSIGAAEAATEAGIAPSYNVLDGFEGNLDSDGHRGGTGWRAIGLPWRQS